MTVSLCLGIIVGGEGDGIVGRRRVAVGEAFETNRNSLQDAGRAHGRLTQTVCCAQIANLFPILI